MSYIDGFVIAVPTAKKQKSIEWLDKKTRDAAMNKMMSDDFGDERMNMEKHPMPFDGKRLIFGGFEPVVELK